MNIINEILIYAILGGCILSIPLSTIGSVVLWYRISYIGDAISHASILGVVISIMLGIDTNIGIVLAALLFMALLLVFANNQANNNLILILAYGFFSLAIFMLSLEKTIRIDVFSFLFGDLLFISKNEIIGISFITLINIIWLSFRKKKLCFIAINENMAQVSGVKVWLIKLEFYIIFALTIAISIKSFGVLLSSSILIIPAFIAKQHSKSPGHMLSLSALVGLLGIVLGIIISFNLDTPTGPSAVISLISLMLIFSTISFIRQKYAILR